MKEVMRQEELQGHSARKKPLLQKQKKNVCYLLICEVQKEQHDVVRGFHCMAGVLDNIDDVMGRSCEQKYLSNISRHKSGS